jgi:DNA-binding NtrC family response regulator
MLSKKNQAADQEESRIYNKLRNREILLVDDDELIRDSLTLFFTGEGIHLSAYESAEKGLEALEKNDYDIIIVDYRLPGMDGVEFFKHIQETHENVLKILITAYKDHKVVSEADKIGIQDFIEKPFTSKRIEQVLSLLIER